jgi:hypothetical protein
MGRGGFEPHNYVTSARIRIEAWLVVRATEPVKGSL